MMPTIDDEEGYGYGGDDGNADYGEDGDDSW
jgi:hypothetical protein